MIDGLTDTQLMYLIILAAAVVLFVVIFLTSRTRRAAQGRRIAREAGEPADGSADVDGEAGDDGRVEPTLRELIETGETGDAEHATPAEPMQGTLGSQLGARPNPDYDKIVSVYLVARAG